MVFRKSVADIVIEQLVKWNVKRLYGIPGDAINSLIDAVRRNRSIEFILVRHEEAGAFAASAEAKLDGHLAACVGTSGPGAIHLLNGLYEAKTSRVPVIALTGQVDSDLIGTDYFQEIDTVRLFSDVTVYNQRIASADDALAVMETACRNSVTRRGVSHVSFPLDLPRREVSKNFPHSNVNYAPAVPEASEENIEKAAALLEAGERTVILAGSGARHAREELIELSERLAAPVCVTLPGKGSIPDEHPNCLGGLGLIGTKPSQKAMEEADTLIMIGTSYPYRQFLPDDAKTVQIDTDPDQMGKRQPVDVALLGDSGRTITRLLMKVGNREDRNFLLKYQKEMVAWRQKLAEDCSDMRKPIRPQIAASALQEVLPDDAIICCDVGNVTVWIARYFSAKGHTFIFSPWLGTMGVALPSSIGAALAHPEKRVAAFAGDGGFTMLMGDFNTAVKYNLPIVTVVINNGVLGMIKFEQEVMGHPQFGIDFHNPNYAEYARACGGFGIRVTEPGEVRDAMKQAMDSKMPSIVEIMADPDERPMPPKISSAQAFHYATALFREKFEF
jgi:pyruvate oxidase